MTLFGHFLDPFFDPFWAVLPRFCPLNPVYRGPKKGSFWTHFWVIFGHFWTPWEVSKKWSFWHFLTFLKKSDFWGHFGHPSETTLFQITIAKRPIWGLKGVILDPKSDQKGVQKVTPSGETPSQGVPHKSHKLISASWTRKNAIFGTFPDSPKSAHFGHFRDFRDFRDFLSFKTRF